MEEWGMHARLAVIGVSAAIVALLGLHTRSSVDQAEAAPQVSNLAVSTEMGANFTPAGRVAIEFNQDDNDGVFVTFEYKDLAPGSKLTRIVRFNGDDYNWDNSRYGRLECCPNGGSGRYGFKVLRLSGRDGELPGGRYEARIYLAGDEVAVVGWGIRTGGGDDAAVPGQSNLDKD
jgi:hypothetical protein